MAKPTRRTKRKVTPAAGKNRVVKKDFTAVMQEVTGAMPRHKRIFSRFIHINSVAAASDLVGSTIARPNAILFGSVASFAFTLSTYLLAKSLGYSLSGSEPIVAFLVGWALGIVFDICAHLFAKRKK